MGAATASRTSAAEWSLLQMLKPEVLANPYPFYARLREREPVRWDPFLHSWVVTSYAETVTVLSKYKAARTPTPEQLEAFGLSALGRYAETMLQQLMFTDAPRHTRLRALCMVAFTPARVEALRGRMRAVTEERLDGVAERGEMDAIADFAAPLPAMAMGALLGIPFEDHTRLKALTTSFVELMGNFDHEPERLKGSIISLLALREYFAEEIGRQRITPREGLIGSLLGADIEGARLTEEEIIANLILVLSGGQEETTNILGSGLLALLCHPAALAEMRDDATVLASAVEELLRFESPTQHTGRIAPEDTMLGGKEIKQGDTVTVVLAAANRDPLRFAEPERLHLRRADNRHLAFGWAAHYCMGAPLIRMTMQVAFPALLRRLKGLKLMPERPPVWRPNMGMHGLESLHVRFDAAGSR